MIQNLEDLKSQFEWAVGSDFWVLGKGPSLAYCTNYDLENFATISLNHACMVVDCKVAHFTDYEAFSDCSTYLRDKSTFVVMPFFPHIRNVRRRTNIEMLLKSDKMLQEIHAAKRLFCYNSSNSPPVLGGPIIELRFFSSEPAYQIAVYLGARKVVTLGVDGGSSYSHAIPNIGQQRLLSNGRSNFNQQSKQLTRLQKRHGVPMEKASEIPTVFVGVAEREMVPFKVLEWSIKKHSSIYVNVEPLPPVSMLPNEKKNRPRTPFSYSRFLIPQLTNYRGNAVYMDSDMLVFGDISELFSVDLTNHDVAVAKYENRPKQWRRSQEFVPGRQYSVMVINCEACRWSLEDIVSDLNNGMYTYADLLHRMVIVNPERVRDDLAPSWNSLENYQPDVTKNVHFTVVPTQPWKNPETELAPLWLEALIHATRDGYVSWSLIRRSIRRGYLHKSYKKLLLEAVDTDLCRKRGNDSNVRELLLDTIARIPSMAQSLRWRLASLVDRGK